MISYLQHPDWNPRVREALNLFLTQHAHTPDAYACFDFDNTSSIFDVEEQLMIYQLETMAFSVDTEELRHLLREGITLTQPAADMIEDICDAYAVLLRTWGPFSASGIALENESRLHQDPYWQEFSAKMRYLYALIEDTISRKPASYAWELYWFTGMTSDEVYQLALRSHARYASVPTYLCHWESPASLKTRCGVVTGDWICGVTVPENTRELWQALTENGIDVWIVSASAMEPIKAAVDYFGLHQYCKGVLAMTIRQDTAPDHQNRYTPSFDYNGSAEIALADGSWQKTNIPMGAQTYRAGKVTAIQNGLMPLYHEHGPLAGFMDAVGDFYFCTVFDSLKLVLCYNRAASSASNGAGLIATIAKYMEDPVCPIQPDDTLYLLQGRDENGLRKLCPTDTTLRYGSTMPRLFAGADCEALLEEFKKTRPTIQDAINTHFTDPAYEGYHSHREKES